MTPQSPEAPNRRILIVDDNEAIHGDYRKILSPAGAGGDLAGVEAALFGGGAGGGGDPEVYELASATQGEQGVALARAALEEGRPFAMAFVDMRMPPGIDGLRTTELLWEADPQLQVVICSAYSDHTAEDIAARLGQTDRLLFLRKPFDSAEVRLLAAALTTKWRLSRQASMRLTELEQLAAARTAELRREVTERRAAEAQLRRLALHDPLTGLHNRAYLLERLRQCIERQRRDPAYRFAVLFMDLDNFKLINDGLGHDTGDELLVAISQRLTTAIRTLDAAVQGPAEAAPAPVGESGSGSGSAADTTARLGGDEFIVLLDGLQRASEAIAIAERIQQRVCEPFGAGRTSITVSVSIGINIVDHPYDRPEDILRDADTAMYRAKTGGKARHAIFDERLHEEALARLALENDLRRALEQGQLRLAFEPIVAAETAALMGFEALLRWQHPERGEIRPGAFIATAEEMGLIVPMGRWVLDEACRHLRSWTETAGPAGARVCVSVNLSRRQLVEPGIVEDVAQALSRHGIEGRRLNLEITESPIVDRFDAIEETLRRLKALGVGLHMDDFGTGLSSLSCLHRFPIDVLKIDRSFIMNMHKSAQFAALVHAVLTLAQNLHMKVIAEGVETGEQLAQLLALDCDYLQGYHISTSLTPEDAGRMIGAGWKGMERKAA